MPRRGRSKGIVEETEPEAPSDIETPPTTVMTQDDVPDSGVESENQVMEIAVVEQPEDDSEQLLRTIKAVEEAQEAVEPPIMMAAIEDQTPVEDASNELVTHSNEMDVTENATDEAQETVAEESTKEPVTESTDMEVTENATEAESQAAEERERASKLEEARQKALANIAEEEAKQTELEKKKKQEEQREADELEAKLRAEEERHKKEATLEKYWAPIRADRDDFPAWTKLLQYVESHEHSAAEDVYNEFLEKYPFCFGYWKKFADFQRIRVSSEAALEVFSRGVRAIPLSVDLWVHYINFVDTVYGDEEPDRVLPLCEQALDAAGIEFRSNKLWDLCLRLAEKKESYKTMWSIYCRLMKTPTLQWQAARENFLGFVASFDDPAVFLSDEEYVLLLKQANANLLKLQKDSEKKDTESEMPNGTEKDVDEMKSKADEGLPPGCDNLNVDEKADLLLSDKEKRRAVKSVIEENLRRDFASLELEVQKRSPFESALKRPYFHVKPLEKAQLKNWRSYLEFEVSEGNLSRARQLFERCLIACACYEEFWKKYTVHLIQHGTGDENEDQEQAIRDVYNRAIKVHLPKKLHIHFEFAAFEEARGHPEAADAVLCSLEKKRGTQLLIALRRIQLARRSGGADRVKKATQLFQKYWTEMKNSPEKGDVECLGMKYVRFLRIVAKKEEDAISILRELKTLLAQTSAATLSRVYMALINCYMTMWPKGEKEILEVGLLTQYTKLIMNLFDDAVANKSLTEKDRLLFSQRRIEFLEDFGSSVETLQLACTEHAENIKNWTPTEEELEKKRAASPENSLPAKRPKVDSTSTQPAPTAEQQAYANYYNQNYYPHAQWGGGAYPQQPYGGAGYSQYGQGYNSSGYYTGGTGY